MALFCALVGCSKPKDATTDRATPKTNPAPIVRTESIWIVHSIAEEIVRLSAYAARMDLPAFTPDLIVVRALPDDAAGFHYAVEVELPKQAVLRTSIEIRGSIWDPQSYVPLTRAVFSQLHLHEEKFDERIDGNPLALLVSPRVDIIQQENRRISQWLTHHPLDAAAHEQAALLIGTLGMRENSGSFWDTRGFCNRAAAHLAIAHATHSGAPEGNCGAVAELLVGLLNGAGRDCDARIEALSSRAAGSPELKPWIVAAELRNHRDYRILKAPSRATLLEQIELFRAKCEAIGTTAACEALGASLGEPLTDWTRILLQFPFTVNQGHKFAGDALQMEIEEAAKIFPKLGESIPSRETLADVLNKGPGHAVSQGADGTRGVEVIDDGVWAMFFQRHLGHAISRNYYFLGSMREAKEAAAEFRKSAAAKFQLLTLYPGAVSGFVAARGFLLSATGQGSEFAIRGEIYTIGERGVSHAASQRAYLRL